MKTSSSIQMAQMPGQKTINTISEFGKKLFGFIRSRVNSKEDAEDILQDVWIQFYNTIEVEEIGQLSAWLYKVARNRITDKYRKKKTESLEDYHSINSEGELDWIGIVMEGPSNPEIDFLREVFWEEFINALEELPDKQKRVFILNELEDKSLKEIAEIEGENLKTIISRKNYAVKRLRERLSDIYFELINN